jgi:hypothetical protein
MKTIAAVLTVLAATAQAGEPIHYTRRQTEFTVRLVFDTQAHVRERCAELGAWGGRRPRGRGVVGCTAYDTVTHIATIYSTEPVEVDDDATTTLGHEVLHAYGGIYHDQE